MIHLLALETGNNTSRDSSTLTYVVVGVGMAIALMAMFLKGRGKK